VPVGGYNKASLPIYQALDCHLVKGLTGAAFGAEKPLFEGLLFASGGLDATPIQLTLPSIQLIFNLMCTVFYGMVGGLALCIRWVTCHKRGAALALPRLCSGAAEQSPAILQTESAKHS
jgi:hypothetical protein